MKKPTQSPKQIKAKRVLSPQKPSVKQAGGCGCGRTRTIKRNNG
jgi:hypothetical protein